VPDVFTREQDRPRKAKALAKNGEQESREGVLMNPELKCENHTEIKL